MSLAVKRTCFTSPLPLSRKILSCHVVWYSPHLFQKLLVFTRGPGYGNLCASWVHVSIIDHYTVNYVHQIGFAVTGIRIRVPVTSFETFGAEMDSLATVLRFWNELVATYGN